MWSAPVHSTEDAISVFDNINGSTDNKKAGKEVKEDVRQIVKLLKPYESKGNDTQSSHVTQNYKQTSKVETERLATQNKAREAATNY